MSDQPEFGWSLPPEENLAHPPSAHPPSAQPPSAQPPPPPPPAQAPTTHPADFSPPIGRAPAAFVTPIPTSATVNGLPHSHVPLWKRWWFIAAIASAVVGAGAVVVTSSGGDKPDAVADTERDREPNTSEAADADETLVDISIPPISLPDFTIPTISIPDFTIPAIAIPPISIPPISIPPISIPTIATPGTSAAPTTPSGLPVIGESVTLADGSTVRVNLVTNDVAANPTFADIVQEGFSLTRIDFEACAGRNGFAGLNPLFWVASLDDGTSADVFVLSYDIILLGVAPGACIRSQLDFEVPPQRSVTTVGVRDSGYLVAANWSTASAVAIADPLTSPTPVQASVVGQIVPFGDFGATATLRTVTPNSAPLDPIFPADPGRQLTRVDVEVCAGSEPMYSSPQNWFATTIDGQIGAAAFFGATFPSVEISPGECVSGMIDIDLPADIATFEVIYGDESSIEVARWRVA